MSFSFRLDQMKNLQGFIITIIYNNTVGCWFYKTVCDFLWERVVGPKQQCKYACYHCNPCSALRLAVTIINVLLFVNFFYANIQHAIKTTLHFLSIFEEE